MKVLRTPDERFANLPDYPYPPRYAAVGDDLRMHYVEAGAPDGEVVLMLHGEPSWSFLYRQMIAFCAAAGHRVVAPDLIGFGRSDKPADMRDYSYARHVRWVLALIEALDLRGVTLVGQDWGALLGLRAAAEAEARFARIVIGNGMLPTGDQKLPLAFRVWRAFAVYSPVFPVGAIVQAGSARRLSRAERRAYDAPFPGTEYLAGARAFPRLVPGTPTDPAADANRAAWRVLERWNKPFLTTFSSGDPIMRGGDRYLQARIPGARGQPHLTLRGGHFLQEDSPQAFAEAINGLIAATPAR